MNLEIFEVVPAGSEGHPRGTCESCGLHLWSEGGYHVPGLKGLFCSLLCIECGVAEKTGQRKQIPGAPIGSGARLLVYLKTVAPQLYAKFAEQIAPSDKKRCLECCTSLEGMRADAQFCDRVHMVRYRRSQESKTRPKREIIGNTPIGKQGLAEAQNGGLTNTLTRPIQGLQECPGDFAHDDRERGAEVSIACMQA
jgi:hypothetical protein